MSIIAIKGGTASDSENRVNNQELDWHYYCHGKNIFYRIRSCSYKYS